MDPLGPFEPTPRLAVAVSGGPDSLALALLADAWARARGGAIRALIVDHGLRAEAAREAAEARAMLASRGIAASILRAAGLRPGTALAARARAARYALLREACAEAGIVHLLLGHHAADQAETLIMRAMAGSGASGLAGMAALVEEPGLRLLRPLLGTPPARLRATLRAGGVGWAEDPSNTHPAALRARLRADRADLDGSGPATRALSEAAEAAGIRRAQAEAATAAYLAAHVTFRPEGFALLPRAPMPVDALAGVIAAIGGGARPGRAALAALAAAPRLATLGGVRFLSAGRLSPGLLAVREPAAVAPPISAVPGASWDGRFRLVGGASVPAGSSLGALGDTTSRLRGFSCLPASVLRVLPALFDAAGRLIAVPHIGWPDPDLCARLTILFAPPLPAGPAPFVPSVKGGAKSANASYVVVLGGDVGAT